MNKLSRVQPEGETQPLRYLLNENNKNPCFIGASGIKYLQLDSLMARIKGTGAKGSPVTQDAD
jgi:hypothetical protein